METVFTPWASLLGGGLIGVATVMLMAVRGRVFGATGLLSGAIFETGDRAWRWALIAGMMLGPVILLGLSGAGPVIEIPVSIPMILVGGVIVGMGVTWGSGCTSGHGVSGLARLSPRSAVATAVFMVTCAATVYLLRHVIGI